MDSQRRAACAIERGELLGLLRKSELLSGLLDDDLDYAAESSECFVLPAGETLFSPGERAKRFYLVRSGEVGAFKPEEPRHELARFVAGDAIADFDFAAGAVLDAEARVMADAELVAFPRRGLGMQDLAREKPDAAARIHLRALSMISKRLRSTQRLISENSPWVRELRRQIYTDASTGLWSRTFLDEELPRSLEPPTAIVLVKPDRFKELNDAHGHGAGDQAMAILSGILVAETEALGRGWAVRLRSNETALVVPRCDMAEATAVARRLAAAVAGIEVPAAAGTGFAFTASVAIAVWPEDGAEWRRLVDGAYGVLTKAWRDGGARMYRLKPHAGAKP
ncbi:MAG: diguanylate cyclase [Spirochaetaceae bacterium]|nr:diguanylate cyclase [Spirochaetaceae bacterium]